MSTLPQKSILRLREVLATSGLARSTIFNRITVGLWPKSVSLGGRAVGWPQNEVAAVITARIAGKSDEEIRRIVAEMEAARKIAA